MFLFSCILKISPFKARLRDAEARLGIRPDQSVQIIYERNQENIWFGLMMVLAAAAVISFLLRSGSASKGSLNTSMFVSCQFNLFKKPNPFFSV